jgi:N-acetylmuramoyl-L-alanine amidase
MRTLVVRLRRVRGCLLATLLAPAALWLAAPAHAAQVRDVRLVPISGGTRLDIAVSDAVTDAVFTLDNPPRVVVDLRPAAIDGRVRAPAGSGLVRQVRIGSREGGILRIVLDVDHLVAVNRAPTATDGRRVAFDLLVAGQGQPATPPSTAPSVKSPSPATSSVAATLAPAAAPPPRPARDLVIAVDAGHGGDDPGATGRDGTHEKHVTLAVARVLAGRINAERGMRAVLIRDGDYFVPLRDRIGRARAAQADLFVSVHADAVRDPTVAGSSVYVLSARGATSEAAKWLADRENAADLVGGVSLEDKDNVLRSVLLDLSQSAAMSASMVAAEKVLNELNTVGEVRKARVQQAGFVVLKSPDIPSLLIETAYITNPGEEKRLRDEKYQARLADAILAGLRTYFHENPPPGTRLAALLAAAGDEPVSPGRTLRR